MTKYHPLFERYKSSNNIYRLPGLDFTVKLKPKQSIRNEGYVPTIIERVRELAAELGSPTTDEFLFNNMGLGRHWANPFSAGGIYMLRTWSDDTMQVILLYQEPKGLPEYMHNAKLIAYQGHEETHALHVLDRLDIIERHARSVLSRNITLDSNMHPETIADVGQILSLLKKGYTAIDAKKIISDGLVDIRGDFNSLEDAIGILGF